MTYQSARSRPGYSWYEDTAGPRPEYPALDGDRSSRRRHRRRRLHRAVGGGASREGRRQCRADRGATVSATAHRAAMAASSAPASARGAEELEAEFGFEPRQGAVRPRRGGQGASPGIRRDATASRSTSGPGQLRCLPQEALRRGVQGACRDHGDTRFNYPHIAFMDAAETAERLGSTHYFGGMRDTGTGHIHPLKLRRSARRAWRRRPARSCFEKTQGDRHLAHNGGKVSVTTPTGTITADKVPDRGQRLWRRSGAGDRRAHHADRLLHRRDGAARRRQPGAAGRRGGRRFPLRGALFPQVAETGRLLFGGREIYAVEGSAGHPHPYPPADQRDLSGAEGRRDHPWLGRLCRHHACRASPSCAR